MEWPAHLPIVGGGGVTLSVLRREMTLLAILSTSDLKSISNNDHYVPLLPDLIFGTTSAVHFHHFSTHTTYGT